MSITASADNDLDKANAASNWGASVNMYMGAYSAGFKPYHMVVRFDSLSTTIPAGAAVKIATLKCWKTNSTGSRTIGAYRVTNAWDEVQSSWNNRLTGVAWTTGGGDFQATATSTTVTSASSNVWESWNILADVQAWLGGTTNNGTLLKDTAETAGQWILCNSREGAAGTWPTLALSYLQKATGLTATAGDGQVSLGWTLPGGSPDYNGTLIVRRANFAPTWTPPDGTNWSVGYSPDSNVNTVVLNNTTLATTFTDTGLTNGTLYYYQAFARDGNTWYSLGSTTASATPTCPGPSDASYVSADAQNGQVTIYWPSGTNAVILQKTSAFASETPGSPGTATQVYSGSAGSFLASGLTNGTAYYYKVFVNASGCYSPGIAVNAKPADTTVAGNPKWSYATTAASMAPPSLDPWSNVLVAGSNDNMLHSMSDGNGTLAFAPFATGGPIQSRPAMVPAAYRRPATAVNIAYVASQDGYLYAVNTSTGAQVWKSSIQLGTTLQGGPGVWLQAFAPLTFTGGVTSDVVIVGTRNTGVGSDTNNAVYALRGDTGAIVWTFNPGTMDIISSVPYLDYARGTVWATSRSKGGTQHSLWKLDAATGAYAGTGTPVLGTNVWDFGDIDGSPTPSADGTFVYVGTNAGDLKAIRVIDRDSQLAGTVVSHTPASGTGAIKGAPYWLSYNPIGVATPDTVILSRDSTVHAVSFNGSTFTPNWTTTVTTPAAAPPSLVTGRQNQFGTSSSSSGIVVTFSGSPLMPAGHLLIVIAGSSCGPLRSVTGAGGTSFSKATSSNTNSAIEIWYGVIPADTTQGVTIDACSPSSGAYWMNLTEWSGLDGTQSQVLDQAASQGGSASPASAPSITTTNAKDLLIFAASQGTSGTFGAPTLGGTPGPWTSMNAITAGAKQSSWYQVLSSTGTYTPSVSVTTSWGAAIAAFKGAQTPLTVSAPVDDYAAYDGVLHVYVGASDGKVHKLRVSDGLDQAQVPATGIPGTLGEPTINWDLGVIHLGGSDGHIYTFALPF